MTKQKTERIDIRLSGRYAQWVRRYAKNMGTTFTEAVKRLISKQMEEEK